MSRDILQVYLMLILDKYPTNYNIVIFFDMELNFNPKRE